MGLQYDAMVAGGLAGVSVDIALFPLDTIKTRMQSPKGFVASGGFRGMYSGLLSAAAGSFPNAALFFCVYESSKPVFVEKFGQENASLAQMTAGAFGEAAACLVRVPTENVKQKLQAGLYKRTSTALKGIIETQGLSGFYTGYSITLLREIPFSMIQFPLWEGLKLKVGDFMDRPDKSVASWESAACGSCSGGIAAAVTTPLDVIKTRLMLGKDVNGKAYTGPVSTFRRIVAEEGASALLSGIQPRVMWISIGGFVFFGAYEKAKKMIAPLMTDGALTH
mmetsp:Transcript_16012/g.19869  ORF Transcript_16012/g.19869 Transcript_16012/m.19869 type:complete len:279 (+) Transcript_16012:216-1052(+)